MDGKNRQQSGRSLFSSMKKTKQDLDFLGKVSKVILQLVF